MSNTKKTIQINPELFKIPGSAKTRKNREKKELKLTPIISPNNLKNKLLSRIKEHKSKETATINSNKSNGNSTSNNSNGTSNYSDEFHGAMNYLSDLTKKQKNDKEREKYKSNLNNKTLKSYSPIPSITNISLELPPELQETTPIKSSYFITNVNNSSDPVLAMNYNSNTNFGSNSISDTGSDVPYGCLKNGSKPTYRDWIRTRKNHEHPELDARPPTPPKKNTFIETTTTKITPISSILSAPAIATPTTISREKRLEQIKQKLKKIQEQEINSNPEAVKLNNNLKILEGLTPESEKKIQLDTLPEIDDIKSTTLNVTEIIEEKKDKEAISNPKQYLKKSTHRKFTLGKSDKLRRVGVLLKDTKTRKNVLDVQHELKKTNITDVRKYLRQHGIIKIGSSAPNDILRKTFEAAMLAGEITNTNKDTLLHNFMNEDTSTSS